jgi:PAS domain S-box-containing protein
MTFRHHIRTRQEEAGMSRISRGLQPLSRDHLAPLKVALYYCLVGGSWILLSDKLLLLVVQDANQLSRLQTVKGWFFVLVSALLLYWLVGHYLRVVHRREAQLRVSEERFRSVFETAAAGMVLMRPDGGIFQANPAFCCFTGFTEEELVLMTITDVTHPDDRERTLGNYQSLSSGQEESVHYEKRYLTRDGRTVWGHASVACLLGRENLPGYCIGLVQDITERKEAEAALQVAHRELEAFVYTVSHDLRSPLTPIIGYADFLFEQCRDRLNEQELNCLAEISTSGARMVALMEDLLTLAKVGQVERPEEPLDAGEIAREVVRSLVLQNRWDVVSVEVGSLPSLCVPRTLVVQIFDNLIGNALRYGCTAGGVVEVGGERRGEIARLFVRDHGFGIPAEERGRIFEVFYRGTTGKHTTGTGIGLATVQKIARLFSGRAWVEETPGGGSTFWVEMIDALPGSSDNHAAVSEEPSGSSLFDDPCNSDPYNIQ